MHNYTAIYRFLSTSCAGAKQMILNAYSLDANTGTKQAKYVAF